MLKLAVILVCAGIAGWAGYYFQAKTQSEIGSVSVIFADALCDPAVKKGISDRKEFVKKSQHILDVAAREGASLPAPLRDEAQKAKERIKAYNKGLLDFLVKRLEAKGLSKTTLQRLLRKQDFIQAVHKKSLQGCPNTDASPGPLGDYLTALEGTY